MTENDTSWFQEDTSWRKTTSRGRLREGIRKENSSNSEINWRIGLVNEWNNDKAAGEGCGWID
jgi:hypothetical protein